jgi:hypothetical protein
MYSVAVENLPISPHMYTTETPRLANPTQDHAMTVKPGKGARQSALVPDHLKSARTLREALAISCNIRFMPKKTTVRAMAEHATEVSDRAGLLWISSLDGTKEYNALRNQGYTLLDVLRKFPSCRSVRRSREDALFCQNEIVCIAASRPDAVDAPHDKCPRLPSA